MKSLPNVVIITVKCTRTRQLFGVRCEEQSRHHWLVDWAFALEERQARREGSDKSTTITGQFALDPAYPKCPYCKTATGLLKCGCGKIACWGGESRFMTCPWCGMHNEVGRAISSLMVDHDH